MKTTRTVTLLTTLAATLMLAGGCTPEEGQACSPQGSYYTHTSADHKHNVSLRCEPAGPDNKLKWVKA